MIDFSNPPFTFVKNDYNYFDIAEQVLLHYNNQTNIQKDKIQEINNNDNDNDNNIKYIYDGEKLNIISYDIIIEKEPINFYDEDNNSFKVYNYQYLNSCLKILQNDYEFYDEKNQIKAENIIFGKYKIIKLKKKIIIDKYFLTLYETLEKNFIYEKKFSIYVDLLNPLFDKIFNQELKEINVYLNKERNSLLKMIDDFIYKEDLLSIFYIMGIDGIGKSFSLLYYSRLKNEKPILYFNLQTINNNPQLSFDLFKYEMMKIFITTKKNQKKDFISFTKFIKTYENLDFWNSLEQFLINTKISYNSVIIIDQYKKKFDENNNIEKIKKIIEKQPFFFKIIISSSINDYDIKLFLISKFSLYIENEAYYGKTSPINTNKVEYLNEYEQALLKIDFNKNIELNNDSDFEKIQIFKQKNINEDKDNTIRIKTNKIEYFDINYFEKLGNLDFESLNKGYEYINKFKNNEKIIYLSKLVIIDDSVSNNKEIIINTLKLFNFNPKYFNKLLVNSVNNKGIINEEIVKKFLDKIYNSIKEKIIDYYNYKNLEEKKINFIEELIELNNFVLKRETMDSTHIIDFIKKYPIKYLIIEEINKEDNFFIKLDGDYCLNKFICKYAFPFIGITINKIILEMENSEEINIRNLSGSALGSFLERKVFFTICEKKIFGNIENKYINNFFENPSLNKKKEIENEFNELCVFELIKNNNYDYLNYNKKILDDFEKNEITNSNISYYIQPKNQSNKSFDSALLINCNSNEQDKRFYLILFQITHHKKKAGIKNLLEYTTDALTTKEYFQKIYSIIIEKVFFYYILSYEYLKEDTIEELINNQISFIYFSYKTMTFMNENKEQIKLEYFLNGKELKYKYEEKNIYEKRDIIRFIESKFVQKKRKNFNNNYQSFELIRRKLLENDHYFYLKKEEKEKIIYLIKKTNKFFSSKELTLIYNFYIDFSDFSKLKNMEDVIGIFSYKENILFTYLCEIYELSSNNNFKFNKEKDTIMAKLFNEFLKENKKKESKKISKNLDVLKSKYIYVYKIYELE
jgi:hypothetical protein